MHMLQGQPLNPQASTNSDNNPLFQADMGAKAVLARVRSYADWAMDDSLMKPAPGTPPKNFTAVHDGELLLPEYVVVRDDGLYVDAARLQESPAAFAAFVSETFSSWSFFFGLDYGAFTALLYEPDGVRQLTEDSENGRYPGEIRFASNVFEFPKERKSLYRSVKVSPDCSAASYLFEPTFITREESQTNPDGSVVTKEVSLRARLDFDEFVAHLWNKGVRYGILEDLVKASIAIDSDKSAWQTVANQKNPIPGRDAEIREVAERMRQDRTPLALENGMVDFKQFQNRFPQVREGERILEKIPMVLGKEGINVTWHPVAPAVPKDVDLAELAGECVKIETVNARTFLVSEISGFINLDSRTRKVSVNEKIIHREGASAKTTGCLNLEGEYFVEYGDVEHGISIEGRNIEILGNLYGALVSKSGKVQVTGTAVNAAIWSGWEEVELSGKMVSNSRIDANKAKVTIRYAENSIIFGREVHIENARNCVVVAEDAQIGHAISTSVVAKRTEIRKSGDDTVLTVEISDPVYLGSLIESLEKIREEELAKLSRLRNDPVLVAFIDQKRKIQEFEKTGGELPRDKRLAFAKLGAAAKPILEEYAILGRSLRKATDDLSKAKEALARSELWSRINIVSVDGSTVVKMRRLGEFNEPLATFDDASLKKESMSYGNPGVRIFMGSSGSFAWDLNDEKKPELDEGTPTDEGNPTDWANSKVL